MPPVEKPVDGVLPIGAIVVLPDGDFFSGDGGDSGGFTESQKARKTHDGEVDGSEQGLTNPDKTGADIDASGVAAHDDAAMPSASEDEARAESGEEARGGGRPPSTP